MFRSRFFWRLFLGHAIVIVLTIVTIGALVVRKHDDDLLQRTRDGLRGQAAALSMLVRPEATVQEFDREAFVREVADDTDSRVTVIRRDGVVVADSVADAATMETHATRPEVVAALEDGYGQDVRLSETTGIETLYVAHVPTPASDVVRVAVGIRSIDEDAAVMTRLLAAAGAVASLLALVISAYIVRRIAVPLEGMRSVAAQLGQGNYAARVELSGASRRGDELGDMARALNRLGYDLSQRVANLTADQERLRAMVAGMVEGVVAVDEDDCVTFSNHAAREILGIEREASDQPLSELSHIAGIDALLTAARQSDSAAQCELEMSVTDEDAVVRAQAHRFNDQDSVGVVVVLQDVSEVRRLEHIRRDFVANVSHELKTPLTSIRGYVETLLDGAIDDDDHNVRFLEKIENNVLRLNHLVTDLLSLARIESQQGRLPLQPVDLHALLEEALRRHEPSALAREQRLVVEAPAGALRVLGDREALTQVIDNLIDNALKYTPDTGAVHVRVQQSEGSTLLEVADDGVGIPQEDQARIFERFYRVDKARSRAVGGTGLGLSIVKHLVGAMQGTIELQSEPGEGSAFRIVLAAA
ncbi:MAG: ATP-binding protein [Planctomycetota bacterium]